jgi:hypothetical protein
MDQSRPQFEPFRALFESKPARVRKAYDYCLCLLMVENGEMELIKTVPGVTTPICMFKAVSGDMVAVEKPPLSQEQIADVLDTLRGYTKDEDLLP